LNKRGRATGEGQGSMESCSGSAEETAMPGLTD